MKNLILWIVFTLMSTSSCKSSEQHIEFSGDLKEYRLVINSTDRESKVDLSELTKAGKSLAPWGAFAYVRNSSGENISCPQMDQYGYSSANATSNFKPMNAGHLVIEKDSKWHSDWYKVKDLLWGFSLCASDAKEENWKFIKIKFYFTVDGKEQFVETDWQPLYRG